MTTTRGLLRRAVPKPAQLEEPAARRTALLLVAFAAVPLADLAVAATGLAPLSRHMATHILLMGFVAPALAQALLQTSVRRRMRRVLGGSLVAATVVQLVLLWGWHAPAVLEQALATPLLHLAMQASLLAAASWFWLAVLAERGPRRWRGILALLITGKLFCLLGVVLVFAPRLLYPPHGHSLLPPAEQLADQQLAGLLMLAACPMTYVVAGVVIAARWLSELDGGMRSLQGRSSQSG